MEKQLIDMISIAVRNEGFNLRNEEIELVLKTYHDIKDADKTKSTSVIINEDVPDGWWYSNYKKDIFDIKTPTSVIGLNDTEGLDHAKLDDVWEVTSGFMRGSYILKDHCKIV